jgi:TatD DNase family protein
MFFTDTHTHLYLNAFDDDRSESIGRAFEQGIKAMFLPNIDSTSIHGMMALCKQFPENCFPMMGLHPTSVKENFKEELIIVEEWLGKHKFYAMGETGIDLYWDKTFLKEQKTSLIRQIELAKKYQLPIVIHMRDSFEETYSLIKENSSPELTGVFHCFTGNLEQAQKIIDLNFMLGIGGVVTFKNSGLDNVVQKIDLKHIILETDSPFLAPVPFRGKRNESAYIRLIAKKIAEIKNISLDEVAEITTHNANTLFNFLNS